jgi:hypothetical protein
MDEKKFLDLNFTGTGPKKCVLPVFLQVFSPHANIFGKE